MTTPNRYPNDDKLSAASLPDNDIEDGEQLPPETEEESIQPASEVAMRLNLLGKLIIPPSAP